MKRIKIGVVGLGHVGAYHLQKYESSESAEIIGVADIVEERAIKAAAGVGCRAFGDYRRLLDQVDAVSIAVPTACHYQVARDFLEAGVDVLLEKPMAATLEEAKKLHQLALKKDLVLQIGFVERFNPAVLALEQVLDKPLFIEAHRLHPFFPRGTDVDVILDLMIHDLDIIVKFVNSPLRDVAALGVSVLSDQIDIANARLTFCNGCVANVTASRVTGKTMQKIRFFGLNGYHAVDYGRRELTSLSRKENDGRMDIVRNAVEINNHDPLEEEIRSFLHAVAHRTAPVVSGEDGIMSLEIAEKIIDKMKPFSERLC